METSSDRHHISPLEEPAPSSSPDFLENGPQQTSADERDRALEAPLEKVNTSGRHSAERSNDFEADTQEKVGPDYQDRTMEDFVEQPGDSSSNEYMKNSHEEVAAVEQDSELHYLNLDDINETATVEFGDDQLESRYQGLDQLDALLEDEKSRIVLSHFRPDSLLAMQAAGWDMAEWMKNGILESLSLLLPVRLSIHPTSLPNELVLLIEPYPGEGGMIELKAVPFLQHLPAIPLSEKQKKAIAQGASCWMYKRVVLPESSEEYGTKHANLWKDLTATLGLERPAFDEVLRHILHAPTRVEEGLTGPFWTEEKRGELIRIVDLHFPLQVAFFTGIHLMFYPFDEIIHHSAWNQLIQQASDSY